MTPTDRAIVAAAEERDRALHYCATCSGRVWDLSDGDEPHNYTVEECDRRLAERSAKQSKPRLPDPDTGHLCWSPEQHHPFIEGPVPEYAYEAWATLDRRELLRIVRVLVTELSGAVTDMGSALSWVAPKRRDPFIEDYVRRLRLIHEWLGPPAADPAAADRADAAAEAEFLRPIGGAG